MKSMFGFVCVSAALRDAAKASNRPVKPKNLFMPPQRATARRPRATRKILKTGEQNVPPDKLRGFCYVLLHKYHR